MQTGPAHDSPRQPLATLAALLREQARRQGDAPALLAPGRSALGYGELQALVQRIGGHLAALGAGPATRVALVLPNGAEMAVAFLGVAACAVCAPLNPASPAAELRAHLQDLRAQMIMLLRSEAGPVRAVARELGLTVVEIEPDAAAPAGCVRVVGELAPPAAAPSRTTADDVALLLHTSGTTAAPKRVPLSQGNLMASAHHIAAHLQLSPADRCLNVMPLFHIHGLVGALLATLAGGGSVVCTPGFDDRAFFDWVASFDPSWTTAVPTIHQALLAQGEAYRRKAPRHRFRFVRSSSAALPAATLRQLQALLQAPVVEAYGMTEATHQMASNPVQPGSQTAGSVGVAAGAQIEILGPAGTYLGVGEPGEIVVRGAGVMRAYEVNADDSDNNEDSDSAAPSAAFHDGWFRTGDLGHLDAQGRLFIAGRLKDIVNRGGEKISPQEVDDALLEHPALVQAAAFGVPHPTLGEDLAAAVVCGPGASVDEAALREHLFARLAAFKVPSQIVLVHRLPTGATGKLQRGGLHGALAALLTQAFVAPDGDDERLVAAILHELLGGPPLGRNDNFFARGGDSLRGAQAVARINTRFGLNLDVTSLFRHPNVAELATAVGAARRLTPAAPALRPRPRGATLVCSPSQEALWVVERLIGEAGVYNIAQALRIVGAIDVPALERALQALLQRHEVLRTGFEERDGVPVPRVHADARVALSRVDARGAHGQPDLLQRLAEAARQPFDLAQAPLLRAALWRTDGRADADEHVLLLVLHHLVADGWSRQVIAHELGAFYTAFRRGHALAQPVLPVPPAQPVLPVPPAQPMLPAPPTLPALPIQFADWAGWQHACLHGPEHEADLRFWRDRLAGLTTLDLPTDRPRPPQPGLDGASERFRLPAALSASLQALARAHDVTLFMLLLAAFKVLLMRWSHQHDVVVGTPVAGRERPELEGLVGYFVNSVVLRTDLSGRPSFADLLGRVRQTALDALAHQRLPFDRLVAELSPQRDLGRNPLYQVSFALNNQPATVCALDGATTHALPLPTQTAKFDLSLSLAEVGGELLGEFEYSTALFDRSTVQRLVAQLQTLLGAIVTDPGERITRLPLMSPAELQQVLFDWNATAQPLQDDPVHALFEHQARRTPDAVALVCGAQRLSYRDLNAQACQLAHGLRQRGVTAEVPVGVCLERSPALVVALLAVLKSGGALLPLDPELPPERIAFMLQDARAALVLTHSRLAERVALDTGGCVRWCVDALATELGAELGAEPKDAPQHALALPCPPAQLAYVIYTSGSTGQPKGVLVEHRGWSNHVRWMQRTLGLTPQDRLLQLTSIGFDAALVELFMPLQAGATLVLAAPGEQRDTARLATLLREQEITVLQMVPSALRALLGEPHFAAGALRHVICGGEALDHTLAQTLLQRLPNATLGNFYGPTETSIDATHFEVPRPLQGAGTVTIGRPIDNTRCVVLDDELQPVPVGVSGELMVGGAGVARGYLNRPELTAERFIADPFTEGQRLYRTGDRARWRADGQLEYLGRSDAQVKLRGQRIELGEIEAALKAQPGVRDAAALVREDVPGLPRLVAYVAGSGIAAADLKAALARQLPEAMVPATFVVMTQWPLLPNGKLDRHALPAPERASEASPATAPRTPTELAVARIWQEVLRVERVGTTDHFFELGGHSLLATQVVSRLRAALHVELPLRAMFEHPTLQAQAAEVDRRRAEATSGAEPIAKIARDGPLVVSYSQRRMWLVQTLNPTTTAYNMTVALRLTGSLDAQALATAVDVVVQRHEAFRTRFALIDGEVVQFIDAPRRADLAQVDLRQWPAGQREEQARAHRNALAGRSFDLSASGLYRVSLLQLGKTEHVLLWVIHHAIGDHWSDGILLRELGLAYDALRRDLAPPLPALRLEYADYAAWQRASVQRDALAPQMAYWKNKLQGLEPLALPHDLEWRELPSGRGGSVSKQLSPEVLEALKRFCNRHGVTPFMAMLACFKLVLSRRTGQLDVAVGSPVANRRRLESESLVGTLVNTLVLRTDLSGNPSFAELLARVRETALDAFAHQDAPFERLVEELQVERSAARAPLVQVMFNVINAPFDVEALPGLRLAPFQFESTAAQFDLALSVDDTFGDVRLVYTTDLFVQSTAAGLLASFVETLATAMADPARRVDSAGLLGATELASLREWNRTQTAFDEGINVAAFIAAGMAPHLSRTALRSGAECLSGAGLQARSARLARALRERGVARGSLVGLCLPRGVDMVAAQLAVLASGAAYVPLDPTYPTERLVQMAQDASLALLLSDSARLAMLDWPAERALLLDRDAHFIAAQPSTPLAPDPLRDARPEDPAYVIYTSGSTGRPKGVVVPQRAVVNFLASMAREPGLSASDVLVAVTTLSFDIAVLELLLPLCMGAELVLASREQGVDGRALRALLEASSATVMQATPSTWRMLVEAGWQGSPSFKALIGGEGLPPDLAQQLCVRACEVWNLYGPTETTVWSASWKVTTAPTPAIRIGRPIANTQIHVLDTQGRPAPIGVAGELFIGGAGVALGYLNRPELTAERFVPDPFSDVPGPRLYRTGDRGRWCHDGLLEHLGRLDLQVKVRGHRIEPGEIEAALATHPRVARCVVIVREDVPGDPRLVAYVVAHAATPRALDAAPDAAAMREHLRASLPEYMLPQHIVALDALPLLPNGKTDRRALPRPDLSASAADRRHDEAPRTDAERAIADVWQALLGVRHIGRADNFFELGGHSLLAMRAVGEIERRAGVRIEMRRLVFESLAQIAASSTASGGDAPPAAHPADTPGSSSAGTAALAAASAPPSQRHSVFGRLLRGPRRSA
jgi:amino acid adenylation domain-containing protein